MCVRTDGPRVVLARCSVLLRRVPNGRSVRASAAVGDGDSGPERSRTALRGRPAFHGEDDNATEMPVYGLALSLRVGDDNSAVTAVCTRILEGVRGRLFQRLAKPLDCSRGRTLGRRRCGRRRLGRGGWRASGLRSCEVYRVHKRRCPRDSTGNAGLDQKPTAIGARTTWIGGVDAHESNPRIGQVTCNVCRAMPCEKPPVPGPRRRWTRAATRGLWPGDIPVHRRSDCPFFSSARTRKGRSRRAIDSVKPVRYVRVIGRPNHPAVPYVT
jgi:hypothetical protein